MSIKSKKVLSGFQLGVAIVVLAAIAGFILISSGLFDSPPVSATQHNHTNNNSNTPASSSVNLNAINEINKLEDVLKNNPNNHEALLSLGHLLNDNGFYERAIQKYELYLKGSSPECRCNC